MGFASLVLLGFPVGATLYAIRQSPRTVFNPGRDTARPLRQHPQAFAQAATAAGQQGNKNPGNAEGAESAGDDPREIGRFQDLAVKESFQEVEPQLQSYLAAHPRSWKAYYLLGYVQFRERKVGESIKSLAKSLEINPDSAEAHRILGNDLAIIGRYDYALREYDAALRLDPASAEVHYNLGKICAIQDDWTKARAEFEKAIQVDANYMEAYNALGFAVEALGDNARAEGYYLTAIRLNEERHAKFDSPYINLSGYYNYQGKLDLSLEYAHKALALNPQSDLAYFQVAKTCRAKQDWKGVVEALEKATAISSWRPQYFYVLGIAYGKLGKTEESKRALQTFQDLEKRDADFERQRREIHRERQGLELRPDE
jgi:tetratricopeptide (TPR) repeat protein